LHKYPVKAKDVISVLLVWLLGRKLL